MMCYVTPFRVSYVFTLYVPHPKLSSRILAGSIVRVFARRVPTRPNAVIGPCLQMMLSYSCSKCKLDAKRRDFNSSSLQQGSFDRSSAGYTANISKTGDTIDSLPAKLTNKACMQFFCLPKYPVVSPRSRTAAIQTCGGMTQRSETFNEPSVILPPIWPAAVNCVTFLRYQYTYSYYQPGRSSIYSCNWMQCLNKHYCCVPWSRESWISIQSNISDVGVQ